MLVELCAVPLLLILAGDPVACVRDLADDRVEVRERAAMELYRRGEEIRGFLVDARDEAVDLETRARIEDVLRRLDADDRVRGFGGANRVGGFAASLRSDRFFGSGPFRLTLEIMNVGPADQLLPAVGTWDQELPDQEIRATGAEARVSLKKFIAAPGFRRTIHRSGDGAPRESRLLRRGEVARFEFSLDTRSVPAGDYVVSVDYLSRELLFDAEENLRTNTVHLMIRK